jgi:hypothetical protein
MDATGVKSLGCIDDVLDGNGLDSNVKDIRGKL